MKTATAIKSEEMRKPDVSTGNNAQNQQIPNYQKKVDRARENLRKAGLTPEVLRNLREEAKKNPPKELSPEESKRLDEDYIFELYSTVVQLERTIGEQGLALEEKDRLIKELRQQLAKKPK